MGPWFVTFMYFRSKSAVCRGTLQRAPTVFPTRANNRILAIIMVDRQEFVNQP